MIIRQLQALKNEHFHLLGNARFMLKTFSIEKRPILLFSIENPLFFHGELPEYIALSGREELFLRGTFLRGTVFEGNRFPAVSASSHISKCKSITFPALLQPDAA